MAVLRHGGIDIEGGFIKRNPFTIEQLNVDELRHFVS